MSIVAAIMHNPLLFAVSLYVGVFVWVLVACAQNLGPLNWHLKENRSGHNIDQYLVVI